MNRFRRSYIAALLLALPLYTSQARGQTTKPGDTDPGGLVFTQIVARIDPNRADPIPVRGLRLYVVTEAGERETLITNGSGVATIWLPKASYRIVTPDAVKWAGNDLSWDFITQVEKGIGPVQLYIGNAKSAVATTTDREVRAELGSHPGQPESLHTQTGGPPRGLTASGKESEATSGHLGAVSGDAQSRARPGGSSQVGHIPASMVEARTRTDFG